MSMSTKDLRAMRCRRPVPGCRGGGAGDRRMRQHGAASRSPGAQRFARPVLAGAVGRGGDCRGSTAFGPVQPSDVAALFDADFLHAGQHALALGPTEEIPWLKSQQRLTFARVGIVDPRSLDDYRAHGGYRGLAAALAMSSRRGGRRPSPIRACAGAAARRFPTGIKWKTCLDAPSRAEIHRLQCRRRRLRYLLRSHDSWKAIPSC